MIARCYGLLRSTRQHLLLLAEKREEKHKETTKPEKLCDIDDG